MTEGMKQMSLSESGFERKTKRTRKREFLDEVDLVVPWAELVALIAPYAPAPGAKGGRPPFAVQTMLRIHLVQQWFNLSDPAMEEALYDTPMFREFVGLDAGEDNLPDESTILRFRHLLEVHNLSIQILATVNATLTAKCLLLKSGTVVDATLIAAPSSTKNQDGERDPEMHQTKKGNQWHLGMKAHAGVDADSGLVHREATTAANAHDVTQAHALLHGEESDVFADSGYRGVEKREEIQAQHPDVNWHIAMMPGKRKALDKDTPMGAILEKLEQTKASIRAKVEHPFRVIKRQFGFVKVKYRGLAKNTANLVTLFALSNLWMVRKRLVNMGAQG
jgi:transposase, IS5 family